MKNLFKFSKFTHILLLCCFFLPFFETGCNGGFESSAEEKAKMEQAKQDSLNAVKALDDAKLNTDIVYGTDTASIPIITTDTLKTDTTKTVQQRDFSIAIIKAIPMLKNVLRPYNGGYSGIGYVIDYSIGVVFYAGSILAFIFLIMGLCLKLTGNTVYYTFICVLNLLSVIGLKMSTNPTYYWGYWCCLTVMVFMFVLDLLVCYKFKKNMV